MGSKTSQRKGAAGERELAAILREYGYDCSRGGSLTFGAVADITGLPGIHIEVKGRGDGAPLCSTGAIGNHGFGGAERLEVNTMSNPYRPLQHKTCPVCSRAFSTTYSSKRYCCQLCYLKARNKRKYQLRKARQQAADRIKHEKTVTNEEEKPWKKNESPEGRLSV